MNHRRDLGAMHMWETRNPLFPASHVSSDLRERLAALADQDLDEGAAIARGPPAVGPWDDSPRYIVRRPALFLRAKPRLADLSAVSGLLHEARRIVVLMGAGASVGQDFRSPGGLYDTIRQSGRLEDPYQVFDLATFRADPSIFWAFAHLVFPPERPALSAAHRFLAALDARGALLRVYTQNVDTLERGIAPARLRCVHGSWRESRCLRCNQTYAAEDLRPAVHARTAPFCVRCGGPIQPGIVFFGQPAAIDDAEMRDDAARADLLLVIGTSLNVRPISELPRAMRGVPQILINREPIGRGFDAELLGDCADVVEGLQVAMGWKEAEAEMREPIRLGGNRFMFPGDSEAGARVVDTGRASFVRTQARRDERDLD
jgi:NAD-dependent SIR2 family protein deacetylase